MASGLISVIIPMYNVEEYLTQCVDSILRQTYSNYEIILVDDGSTDNTYLIAKELSNKYPIITLLHKENGGQASARNVGLKYATGDYISFIDADDFIGSKMFESLIVEAQKNDLDIIECCYQDVFLNSNRTGNSYYLKIQEGQVYSGIEFYNLKPSLSPCDKLYKKAFLEDIGFCCTEGHYAEDAYDTTFAIINARRIAHKNTVYYYYRRDNLGSTRNNDSVERRIKLGKDKLFIANKLDQLKQQKQMNGYINTVIVRNAVGSILNPVFFKSKQYRKALIKCFHDSNGFKLIKDNISVRIAIELFGVGIRKIVTKGD